MSRREKSPLDQLRELEEILYSCGRPEMLGKVVPNYEHESSMYPESVRVSFGDGKTIIYDRRVEQPAPVFEENIRIIRKWKQGYVNRPRRRRRNRT